MFKKALFLILFLFLISNAFAIRLVEPISKDLIDNSFVGSIVPGQTLELIVSKELGFFDSLKITSELPDFFSVSVKDYLESFKIIIVSNERTPKTNYNFSFTLQGISSSESVNVFFSVEDSLLDSTLLNYSSNVFVNDSAEYSFLLINNSDADAVFKIEVGLPWYWLGENYFGKKYYKEIIVPKQSKIIEKIIVFPRIHGEHHFLTKIIMQSDYYSKSFTLSSKTSQTITYKLESSLNGFPFFSISILPSYFLTGVLTSIFN